MLYINGTMCIYIKENLSLRCVLQPYSSKACINLDVKLGGLGPDYEAIKEKVSGPHLNTLLFS